MCVPGTYEEPAVRAPPGRRRTSPDSLSEAKIGTGMEKKRGEFGRCGIDSIKVLASILLFG